MNSLRTLAALALAAGFLGLPATRGAGAETALPTQFQISKMKTSILVAQVTLSTGTFRLTGDNYTASYVTKVSPWSFKNESGTVTLKARRADYERLQRGEPIELTGQARNTKGQVRQISVLSRPADKTSGKSTVRVSFGATKLVFHGDYRISGPKAAAAGGR